MKQPRLPKTSGFTIPEVILVIVLMAILLTSIVGATSTWLGSYSIAKKQGTANTDLRVGLSRISSDISQSYTALINNTNADPNAPTPPSWIAGTTNGPLILGKTARNATDGGIYDTPELFVGKPDSIIYYLNNGTLYRRVVPANYGTNVLGTSPQTCSSQPGGGCPQDTKILSDVTVYNVTYLDETNTPTTTATSARSILVEVELTRNQSGKNIKMKDKIQIALVKYVELVPPSANPGVPQYPLAQTFPGLIAGPAGLNLTHSTITGNSVFIGGKLALKSFSKLNANTNRIDIDNYACGTGASYGSACTSPVTPSVSATFMSKATGTPICANGQTTNPNNALTGWTNGGCAAVRPAPSIMPVFDKQAFTNIATVPYTGPTTCTLANSPVTIPANARINGDLVAKSFCTLIFQGNAYIKGKLTIGYATVKIDDNASKRPIIAVNSTVDIRFFSKILGTKNNTALPIIISFYSSDSGNSTQQTCSNADAPLCVPTAASLYVSARDALPAIVISNGAEASASFYAYFDTIDTYFATITGSLVGQGIDISGISKIQLTPGVWPDH